MRKKTISNKRLYLFELYELYWCVIACFVFKRLLSVVGIVGAFQSVILLFYTGELILW